MKPGKPVDLDWSQYINRSGLQRHMFLIDKAGETMEMPHHSRKSSDLYYALLRCFVGAGEKL